LTRAKINSGAAISSPTAKLVYQRETDARRRVSLATFSLVHFQKMSGRRDDPSD
jgi:hypothetical protein